MSTPFEIESFEEYLMTVRNELPTRFMDWTTNPLVALYFALELSRRGAPGGVRIWP